MREGRQKLRGEADWEWRALERRRRRRRMRIGLAWSIVGCLALGVGVALKQSGDAALWWVRKNTSLFEVRAVDPGKTKWVSPWELVDAAGVSPGDDLLGVVPKEVEARLDRLPRVQEARVTRTWNRKVRVEVQERRPVALWMGDTPLEVSADGTVLGTPPPGAEPEWPAPASAGWRPRGVELPLLTGVVAETRPGERLESEGALAALRFLVRLETYGIPGETWISEIWARDPDGLVLTTLRGGVQVKVGDGRLSKKKLMAVSAVLERIQKDAEPVETVDARFRHQVVVKESG